MEEGVKKIREGVNGRKNGDAMFGFIFGLRTVDNDRITCEGDLCLFVFVLV